MLGAPYTVDDQGEVGTIFRRQNIEYDTTGDI
jgi:hypothetical protein